ncbi:hypothetical protein NL676_011965 [Syzygium grande]|nr:hypothetical protein NL676_011965 [Syzygium grande]
MLSTGGSLSTSSSSLTTPRSSSLTSSGAQASHIASTTLPSPFTSASAAAALSTRLTVLAASLIALQPKAQLHWCLNRL